MSPHENPAVPMYYHEEWRREQQGRQLADPQYLVEFQERERKRRDRVQAQAGQPLPEFESASACRPQD
jgi:hypothetical protein